jgi:bacterioferritin-associated ferredoxin
MPMIAHVAVSQKGALSLRTMMAHQMRTNSCKGLLLREVPLGSQCSSCLELLAGVYQEIWIGINIYSYI